jgi:hypothetical protein
MTIEELAEKQDREHAEWIERLMHQTQKPTFEHAADKTRETFMRHGVSALAKVKHGRAYACNLVTARELGAFALAYRDFVLENNGRFELSELTKLLEELAQIEDLNLRKKLPHDEVELKPILDPVTQLPINNPWSDPVDLTSQMALERDHPELAKVYRESKKGSSYSLVAKMKADKEAREKIRAIAAGYGPKQHTEKENPFLLPRSEGLNKQSEFVKAHEADPHVVDRFKQEAAEKPTLNFGNLTVRMAVTKRSPLLGQIYQKAEATHKTWLDQDRAALKQQAEDARAQLQKLEFVATK